MMRAPLEPGEERSWSDLRSPRIPEHPSCEAPVFVEDCRRPRRGLTSASALSVAPPRPSASRRSPTSQRRARMVDNALLESQALISYLCWVWDPPALPERGRFEYARALKPCCSEALLAAYEAADAARRQPPH